MVDRIEKRQFTRTKINVTTQYQVTGAGELHEGFISNISAGGILLWSKQELQIGTMLYLFIRVDDLADTELEVTATIVRIITSNEQEDHFGYGCRFESLYASDRDAG